jgi:hypothetical protein
MIDYSKGRIYRIWDNTYTECYIGSTVEALSLRMAKHRQNYKQWLNGKGSSNTCFTLFEKYGVGNCKIELLENYPCASKAELEAREGHHQRLHHCINKNIAGRSDKEYYNDHKEHYKEYRCKNKDRLAAKSREYYEKNKCAVKERARAYRDKFKDIIKERKRLYYQNNKDSFAAKASERIVCECGCELIRGSLPRHERTQKHQTALALQA